MADSFTDRLRKQHPQRKLQIPCKPNGLLAFLMSQWHTLKATMMLVEGGVSIAVFFQVHDLRFATLAAGR